MKNSKSKSDAFQQFWNHISNAEHQISTNFSRPPLPPDCFDDPWDEQFAESYKLIQPYLKISDPLLAFAVPPWLPFHPAPIFAETASQALMFFLNPTVQLQGFHEALLSPEFIKIKKEAQDEFVTIVEHNAPDKITKSKEIRHDIFKLHGYIHNFHFENPAGFVLTPLKSSDIQRELEWTPSKVTRRMKKLFKCDNPMRRYHSIFIKGMPKKECMNIYKKTVIDVKGYDNT